MRKSILAGIFVLTSVLLITGCSNASGGDGDGSSSRRTVHIPNLNAEFADCTISANSISIAPAGERWTVYMPSEDPSVNTITVLEIMVLPSATPGTYSYRCNSAKELIISQTTDDVPGYNSMSSRQKEAARDYLEDFYRDMYDGSDPTMGIFSDFEMDDWNIVVTVDYPNASSLYSDESSYLPDPALGLRTNSNNTKYVGRFVTTGVNTQTSYILKR